MQVVHHTKEKNHQYVPHLRKNLIQKMHEKVLKATGTPKMYKPSMTKV
jgi:hypothetical protein